MNPSEPKISFTFPYRWLTDEEDKKFLSENLIQSIRKQSPRSLPVHPRLATGPISAYAVVLKYRSYQPVKIPLTQQKMEKLLKPYFTFAKCVSFETFFGQAANQI